MFLKTVFVTILVIGSCVSDTDIRLPSLSINTTDETGIAFHTICGRAGVTDEATIAKVIDSGKHFAECIYEFINPNTITNEIEEAKDVHEVLKKYCDKSSQLKACYRNLIESFRPCLNHSRDDIAASINVTEEVVDFICYKDGDRIALFLSEGGPQCIQEKYLELTQCVQPLSQGLPNYEAIDNLTLAERCSRIDYSTAYNCIVKSLQGCDTPTVANMAESLLNIALSPCLTLNGTSSIQ